MRALDELVEEDALDDDAWIDALSIVDAWAGSAQHHRIDADLGRALRRWIVARSARPGFWAGALATIAIDVWRKTADCTPQYLCDFAGAALKESPDDEAALELFLQGTFADAADPYLHRGVDLEVVASAMSDGPRKAELLALHALIHERAGMSRAGEALERALAIDPSLDLSALRARLPGG